MRRVRGKRHTCACSGFPKDSIIDRPLKTLHCVSCPADKRVEMLRRTSGSEPRHTVIKYVIIYLVRVKTRAGGFQLWPRNIALEKCERTLSRRRTSTPLPRSLSGCRGQGETY